MMKICNKRIKLKFYLFLLVYMSQIMSLGNVNVGQTEGLSE